MRKSTSIAACLLWLVFLSHLVLAQVAQPTPMPNTFVHDFAGVLSAEGKAQLQASAQRLKDEYKTEIAIVTIDSLQGEDSFDYSMRMARSWGIGSKDNDIRGLLILIAIKDHKTAFRTSRHIEGELPDGVTGSISREMNAYFKKGDFNGGLVLGMNRILEKEKAVYEPQAASASQAEGSGFSLAWLWLLFPLAAVPIFLLGRRKKNVVKKSFVTRPRSNDSVSRPVASSRPAFIPKNAYKEALASSRKRATPRVDDPPAYRPSTPSSYDYSSSSSSSSSDSGSSSSSDSGSSYSGGSDFGGGGSDSSW